MSARRPSSDAQPATDRAIRFAARSVRRCTLLTLQISNRSGDYGVGILTVVLADARRPVDVVAVTVTL